MAAIRAWKACGVSVSERPSRRSRSILAASAVASADAVPLAADSETGVVGRALLAPLAEDFGADLVADLAADFGIDLAATALAVAALRGDIDVVPFLHDLVLAQPHLAIGDAFAGLHVVFHAVPGADEMQLGFREVQPARGLVRHDPLFNLGDG